MRAEALKQELKNNTEKEEKKLEKKENDLFSFFSACSMLIPFCRYPHSTFNPSSEIEISFDQC